MPASIAERLTAAREAQGPWARLSVKQRVKRLRAVRCSIGTDPVSWVVGCTPPQDRTTVESLSAEVGPVADACQWLEQHAADTLKKTNAEQGWGDRLKPGGVSLSVERKPLGTVLVIGASNYPFFLLAVPALQALAAGNAVLLKPPAGGEAVAELLHDTLVTGGMDARLCPVLESSVATAEAAIDADVDHIVVTGSAETGRAVAKRAASSLTPCTLECSGNDAVVVLPQANLERVAECVAWALAFNAGATCIGPRRLIAGRKQLDELGPLLIEQLARYQPRRVTEQVARQMQHLVSDALSQGAALVTPKELDLEEIGTSPLAPPIVVRINGTHPALLEADVFGPVLSLISAESDEERVAAANDCGYALGASVFGPEGNGEAWEAAGELRAGCVTIDDVLAPTADPRVPFGGTGRSGYGVTRGREGLLAMTRPQAIATRQGHWLPHLDPETPALPDLLAGMIQSRHATGLAARWRGMRRFLAAARQHQSHKKNEKKLP